MGQLYIAILTFSCYNNINKGLQNRESQNANNNSQQTSPRQNPGHNQIRRKATRVLTDGEYLVELDRKLSEECAEYQADKSLEEMADVLEVLYAIATARGYSVEELERVRAEKAEKRGGFADKIFLEEVLEN